MSLTHTVDYEKLNALTEREKYRALFQQGIDRGIAPGTMVAILAIGDSETGGRTYDVTPVESRLLLPSYTCPRLTLGFEPGMLSFRGIKERALQESVLRDYVTGKTSLGGKVWVSEYVPGVGMLWAPGAPFSKAHLHHFFETVLNLRNARGLAYFSIGLTQQYLTQTLMYKQATDSGTVKRLGWPHTWRDLYNRYFGGEGNLHSVIEKPAEYIDTGRRFPGPTEGTDEAREYPVVVAQFGSDSDGARAYYEGTGSWTNGGGIRGRAVKIRGYLKLKENCHESHPHPYPAACPRRQFPTPLRR